MKFLKIYGIIVLMILKTIDSSAQLGEYYIELSTNDLVDGGDLDELDSVSQFTFEVHLNIQTLNAFTQIINKQLNSTNRLQLQIDNGKIVCIVANGSNSYRQTGYVLEEDVWYHIAMVFDGNQSTNEDRLKLYVDGEELNLSGSGSGTLPSVTPSTSASIVLGDNTFDGFVDEVRVWDTALSQSDINIWKVKEIDNRHISYNDLVLYWQFDDDSSTSLVEGALNTTYDGTYSSSHTYSSIENYEIHAYFLTRGINVVDPNAMDHLTHVILKNAKPMIDGSISEYINGVESSGLIGHWLDTLKEDYVQSKPVKILMGMGGGAASGAGVHWPTISASASLRSAFAINAREFCFDHGFDGIDINWEFPSNATQKANWVLLLDEIYTVFNASGLIVEASFHKDTSGQDLMADSDHSMDYGNVQIYNGYLNNLHAPYNYFKNIGDPYLTDPDIDKSKVLLGVPFYSRRTSNPRDAVGYRDLFYQVGNGEYFTSGSISGLDDDIAYNSQGTHVAVGNYSFNGVRTMKKKARYIIDNNLPGMMVFEMYHDVYPDSEYSLITAINQVLPIDKTPLKPTVGFTSDLDSISAGETIQFTDKSSREPSSWSWSFPGGNPSTSTSQNPQVEYSEGGNYEVTLSVTNGAGTSMLTRTAYIKVTQPQGHWKFNWTSGIPNSSYLNEGSESDALPSLTYAGSPSLSSNRKEGSNSIEFNGTTQYAELSPSNASNFMHESFGERTVTFWVNPGSLSGDQTLYDEGHYVNGLAIRLNDNDIEARASANSVFSSVVSQNLASGVDTWYHVAVVFDNGNVNLYLNAGTPATGTSAFTEVPSHANAAGFGATNGRDVFYNADGPANYFDGLLDDLRVYDQALNANQITSIYNEICSGCRTRSISIESEVEEQPNDTEISVYPNPANESVEISFLNKNSDTSKVSLVDMKGNLIWQKSGFQSLGQQKIKVNTQSLPLGIYIIRIHNGEAFYNRKLIKAD